MDKRKKIIVAMSGGVDSSVAALLLKRQGYDVTGAFMVNYDGNPAPTLAGSKSCWTADYRDALRVAAHLGIPLLRLNFTKEYERDVLKYLFREYRNGRTPNPDVLCNKHVKFGAWLDKAKALGFDYLATGHYARLRRDKKTGSVELLTARDKNKDQTYFLHQLSQKQLKDVLFPLGEYGKIEVRRMALRAGLPTANKEESMGICFVGEVPMRQFLQTKIKPAAGKIITTAGAPVGRHQGLPFYTVGERHLGAPGRGEALYVAVKRRLDNAIIVASKNDPALYSKKVVLKNTHWVSGHSPQFPLKCTVRLRHRAAPQKAAARSAHKKIEVSFAAPQWGVTPGQFAVLYKGGVCLGGAVVANQKSGIDFSKPPFLRPIRVIC